MSKDLDPEKNGIPEKKLHETKINDHGAGCTVYAIIAIFIIFFVTKFALGSFWEMIVRAGRQ